MVARGGHQDAGEHPQGRDALTTAIWSGARYKRAATPRPGRSWPLPPPLLLARWTGQVCVGAEQAAVARSRFDQARAPRATVVVLASVDRHRRLAVFAVRTRDGRSETNGRCPPAIALQTSCGPPAIDLQPPRTKSPSKRPKTAPRTQASSLLFAPIRVYSRIFAPIGETGFIWLRYSVFEGFAADLQPVCTPRAHAETRDARSMHILPCVVA